MVVDLIVAEEALLGLASAIVSGRVEVEATDRDLARAEAA